MNLSPSLTADLAGLARKYAARRLVLFGSRAHGDNSQIAVVSAGDEYTLKRAYCGKGYVELRAESPTFSPIILRRKELDPLNYEVIGLAVAFLSGIQ
nr:MAG TPA: SOS regulatory protein LexA [Caudoviricetes sp.]